MEKIIVKNFGPIKDVELEIKDINVFIGSTSSGKSTVAKLIAISRELKFVGKSSFDRFTEFIQQYNIDFEITDETYIRYSNNSFYWELQNRKVEDNGTNWVLTRLIKPLEEVAMLFHEVNSPDEASKLSPKEKGTRLLGFFLLSGIDEIVKFEYGGLNEDLPEQVRELLEVISEYDKQIDRDNLANENNNLVMQKAMADSRFLELLPLMDVDIGLDNVNYVPAERILLSMIAESVFGLMNNNVAIAQCIKDFGAQFESARKRVSKFSIPFLDAEYSYSDKSNFVTFSDGAKIKLEQASSGLQSIIPLILVIERSTTSIGPNNYFVIEEPELNLYPIVQKELIEFIVERINKSKDKLIITTHSPYVLTSLDNLIQASSAAKANSEQKEKVAEIVPEEKWVDFDRVACYYFEEGSCRSTLDTENQTIGASNIDDVSEELGKTFEQLLELKYAHVS